MIHVSRKRFADVRPALRGRTPSSLTPRKSSLPLRLFPAVEWVGFGWRGTLTTTCLQGRKARQGRELFSVISARPQEFSEAWGKTKPVDPLETLPTRQADGPRCPSLWTGQVSNCRRVGLACMFLFPLYGEIFRLCSS